MSVNVAILTNNTNPQSNVLCEDIKERPKFRTLYKVECQ